MTKWEYCALGALKSGTLSEIKGHYPKLIFFSEDGSKDYDVEHVNDWKPKEESVVKAIAWLGNEGWEMVTSSPVGGNTIGDSTRYTYLFFKRPKP
ncbi:hypothetical protein [Candidatus Leptofilum sp.]|uniref:hypothetical protein n=1 Tax=Candidatus Leptofilum sp. TaxID=3241576 RepID=UPI003B59240D